MARHDLSAQIGSRICHDLISPLGAIGNGLELLEMTGVGNSPELDLIRDSVATANARVRLFRIAFGSAIPGQRMSGSEVTQALSGLGERKVAINWTAPPDIERAEARLLLLCLMCAETMMPLGGLVDVTLDPPCLSMSAERFRTEPDFVRPLTDPTAETEPSMIHFACARDAAAALGRSIALIAGPGRMMMRAG